MRRLPRSLFNGLAAISALLIVATSVLWVRSYWLEDRAGVAFHWHYASFACFRGTVGCEFGRRYELGYSNELAFGSDHEPVEAAATRDYMHIAEAESRLGPLPHYHDMWGFRWHPRTDRDWEYRERGIAVPLWSVIACFALLPAYRAWPVVAANRYYLKGHCRNCGYDLRATPDRCPECGAAPKGKAVI